MPSDGYSLFGTVASSGGGGHHQVQGDVIHNGALVAGLELVLLGLRTLLYLLTILFVLPISAL